MMPAVAVTVAVAVLERFARFQRRALPFFRPRFVTDVVYLVTGWLATASLAIAWVALASEAFGRLGIPRVTAVPRWAALPLALVALDAGNYAVHWLLHRVDALWEFHKIHHSSPELDWLATFRSHIVEQALRRLAAPLLLALVGVPLDAVVAAGGVFMAWAVLNHANLRPAVSVLEPVFVTPRLHRLHHVPRTTERNLGTVLTVWDRLRGTLVVPVDETLDALGLPGERRPYPEGWATQLVEPLRRLASRRPMPGGQQAC
jgi:sterol desaturase/sphingolipid hydroxylase (fatty acid hydroxylase superfamily)